MAKNLNYCFFGSSDFSVFVLKEIIKIYPPALVVTLPAKPQGRGLKIQPNPVYSFCLEKKLEVVELKDWQQLKSLSFAFGLVAGFGKIIPREIFSQFKQGLLNLHPSLLPKYRGANPIRETILNGESETGVTLILIDELVDHGPIICQQKLSLSGRETYTQLLQTLGRASGYLINQCLELWLKGDIKPQAQDDSSATFTKKIHKEDGYLNSEEAFLTWDRKIRALNPWPGTFMKIIFKRPARQPLNHNQSQNEKLLKIFAIEKLDEKQLPRDIQAKKIGEFFSWRNSLGLKISDAFITIKELQLEGKKKMSSREFLNGYKLGGFQLATT
jgi:methionyl-tRNA formyltransferase